MRLPARHPHLGALLVVCVAASLAAACNADDPIPIYETPEEYFTDMNVLLDEALSDLDEIPEEAGEERDEALRRLREKVERIRSYKFAAMDRLPGPGGRSFRFWYVQFEFLDWILVEAWSNTFGPFETTDQRERAREQLRITIEMAKEWKESLEEEVADVDPRPVPGGPPLTANSLETMNLLLGRALEVLEIDPLNELNFDEVREALGSAKEVKRLAVWGMPKVRGKTFLSWYDAFRVLDSGLEGALRLRADTPGNDKALREFLGAAKGVKERMESWLGG